MRNQQLAAESGIVAAIAAVGRDAEIVRGGGNTYGRLRETFRRETFRRMTAASLAGRAILVVEDEAAIALLIEDTLIDAGAEVIGPAATVAAALQAVADEPRLDAAVVDINLGGESGDAVADALARRGVPFAVMTGYGRGGVKPRHADRRVLSKPFTQGDLLSELSRLCGG